MTNESAAFKALSDNLKKLMARHKQMRSQAAIGKAAGIDQTTAGRILNGKNAPSVDTLDGLAKAFGLEPWQLLLPNLNIERIELAGSASADAVVLAARFDGMSESHKKILLAVANVLSESSSPS